MRAAQVNHDATEKKTDTRGKNGSEQWKIENGGWRIGSVLLFI